jgi:hypothetical protein
MAREKLDTEGVIRKASKELGLDEEVVRDFVERNELDAVALYEEKLRVMERRPTISRAFGVTASSALEQPGHDSSV